MEAPSLLHWVSDIDYFNWLVWLFTPVAVAFLLPTLIIALLYFSIIFLHVYRYRRPLRDAYARDFWDGARYTLALLWTGHGRVWHGYEVRGLENIPDEGGALLVYYHGALPLDYYYLVASCLLHKRRLIRGVGDRFVFRVPGFKILTDVFKAQFGDERYRLLWKKRLGFAKAAIEARVPVVPVFTQNIREAFRSVAFGRGLFKKLYDKTRLPIVPIYGGFPVKMRTFVGPPIPFDPNASPSELAHKAATAVESLIRQHQEIPGSIVRALAQRFDRT